MVSIAVVVAGVLVIIGVVAQQMREEAEENRRVPVPVHVENDEDKRRR